MSSRARRLFSPAFADPRAVSVFERLLNEDDRRLRLHTRRGLERYVQIGVTAGAT